jgi:dTDP-4-amino-4,6-dideoxygalactose transaminase
VENLVREFVAMYQIGKEEIDAVRKVIESGQLFRYRGGEGGWCDKFEKALAGKIGVRHALTVSSGTAALMCSLVGVGVGPGDEVIVPGYTFMASALAVTAVGGIPIIAEIDETLAIDPRDVEKKITRYTKAILPVHMVGRACDMAALTKIAKRRKLAVVEDACQAVGGSYRGKRLGSIGQAGTLSFNHFKIITCGEGGGVLTNDKTIFERARIFHDGGCVFRSDAKDIKTSFFAGQNLRVSEIQGAILSVQLARLEGILRKLRANQAAMRTALSKSNRFQVSPSNEVKGDCGTHFSLLFESASAAMAFVRQAGEERWLGCVRPIDTGRHVYSYWDPILQQQGSHTPKLNPFAMAKRKIEYSADMCPRTLDILGRTVLISVPFDLTAAQTKAAAKKMLG